METDAGQGMVRVPLDAFVDVTLRLPRLRPLPPLDGSLGGWPAEALLPDLARLHGQQSLARAWAGWTVDGLAMAFDVRAPHALAVDPDRPFWSDGVQIWCDCRDSRDARKLTRFCHQFVVLPRGGGPRRDQALAMRVSHGEGAPPRGADPRGGGRVLRDQGYAVEVLLPREAMDGYAPLESGSVGLAFRVRSSMLGVHDLAYGEKFPLWRNPSLWLSARLDGAAG